MSVPVASALIIDVQIHSTIWIRFHRSYPNRNAPSNLWLRMWETIGSELDEVVVFHLLRDIQNHINP